MKIIEKCNGYSFPRISIRSDKGELSKRFYVLPSGTYHWMKFRTLGFRHHHEMFKRRWYQSWRLSYSMWAQNQDPRCTHVSFKKKTPESQMFLFSFVFFSFFVFVGLNMTFETYDGCKRFYTLIKYVNYTFQALFDFTPNLCRNVIWLFCPLLWICIFCQRTKNWNWKIEVVIK